MISVPSVQFVYNLTDIMTSEEVRWEGEWSLLEDYGGELQSKRNGVGGNGQCLCLVVVRLLVKPPGATAYDLRYPISLSEVKNSQAHLGDLEKREMWLKLKPLDETRVEKGVHENEGVLACTESNITKNSKSKRLKPNSR